MYLMRVRFLNISVMFALNLFFFFQHIVYITKFVLSYAIPDVPDKVKEQIKREKYLTQALLHEANLKQPHATSRRSPNM